ncbi:nicotinate-nucleotide adenylyltransferase [Anaerobranca californiensis DSM 14826]|jgi:nicotinate-nucleotide adenylyltransferase|uniref:Probable nicotinate-nucleotide adenylyltransferase n=1 Tax=Anaerobranca californiensis DSM 14826 TaxID=1120989 RepID=A0A1M6NHA7_9FIRM|nr:nicotinate-nucleotide adenylyltransferase [Anaerobranca californiensis]SHJ95067.1 nicotinate-nucleotide adenylyltransferase [Anaerobranca californiensis DSM 14826]
MDKILIFGGSFDPVHLGHLILAQICGQRLKARVIFLPTGNPPHKTITTPVKHRLEMLKLAIKGNENFQISTYEVEKQGVNYTFETLAYLKKFYNKDLYFLVGGDSLLDIHKWKEPEKILELCTLVYAKRKGFEFDVYNHLKSFNLNPDKVVEIDTPIIEISSTDIRLEVKRGNSIKYLVPDAVEQYIYQHGLYK